MLQPNPYCKGHLEHGNGKVKELGTWRRNNASGISGILAGLCSSGGGLPNTWGA